MGVKLTPYQAGQQAGNEADAPMDAFQMSQRHDDYVIGYIVGYSEMESFRQASPRVAAMTAGELGHRYHVSYDTLLPHMGFKDRELRQEMRQAYADAAETAAEEGDGDDE